MNIQRSIRDLAQRAGFDVRRHRPLATDPLAAQRFLLGGQSCRAVFDVGAHLGETTASYRQLFPQAAVYAFEPYPPSFEQLSARFANNGGVHLVNAAVSSEQGQASFHVNAHSATNSLLPRPETGRRYYSRDATTQQTITVPTVALDDFCKERQLASPDIIKLDIQGNELAALRGAENLLQTNDVSIIYTEIAFVPHYEGGVLFPQLSAHLAERGYTLFNFYDLHWASIGQLRFGDALFISSRLRQSYLDRLPDEP